MGIVFRIKDEVLNKFDILRKKLENLLDCSIVSIKQIIVVNLIKCNLEPFVNNMEYLITYWARSLLNRLRLLKEHIVS